MTKETVKTIAKKKLGEYGAETKEVAASYRTPRKPMKSVSKLYAQKRTQKRTSASDYAKLVPAIKTPSAFSKVKVDEVLLQCCELPTPDEPQKNYAGYSREEWDTLLEVFARYAADVLEGAGLEYKGFFAPEAFKKAVSLALQENFFHRDPYDGRRRFISVDGRIDSDKRKA